VSEHDTVENGDAHVDRARAEIRAQAATLLERPLLERSVPQIAIDESIDRTRLAYRIGELTDANHRAFVEQAFQALLKRAPTPDECGAMLALLAAGATKAEALGNLRWSPEGRVVGARVAGLAPRYAMAKLRRVPLLGYLVDIPLNLAALPALARHQRASDAVFAARDAAVAQATHRLAMRADEQSALAQRRLDDLHAFAHELNVARDELARLFGENDAWVRTRLDMLESAADGQRARLDDLEIVRRQLHGMSRWRDALEAAFARLECSATASEARDARQAESIVRSVLASSALPHAAWANILARRLAPGARVLTPGGDPSWSGALVARGFDAVELADDGVDAAETRLRWSRCADASVDAASVLSLPTFARGAALPAVLAEIGRVVGPGGTALLAFARDAAALRAALCGEAVSMLDVEVVEHALAASGFADIERIDVDGASTLFARLPSA